MKYLGFIFSPKFRIYFFQEGFYVSWYMHDESKVGWYPAKKFYAVQNIDFAFYKKFTTINPSDKAQVQGWMDELKMHWPADNADTLVCIVNADDEGSMHTMTAFLTAYFQPAKDERVGMSAGVDLIKRNTHQTSLTIQGWGDVLEVKGAKSENSPDLPPAAIRIDQLDQSDWSKDKKGWGVCGWVAAIQAAYFQGKTELLKKTTQATLTSCIMNFYKANPDLTYESPCVLRYKDGKILINYTSPRKVEVRGVLTPINDALAIMEKDLAMECGLSLSLDVPEFRRLLVFLGVRFTYFSCLADVGTKRLSLKNVIYFVHAKQSGIGHIIYVDAQGYHYSWGSKFTTDEMITALDKYLPAGDLEIHGCCKLDANSVTPLDQYSKGDPFIQSFYQLDPKSWGGMDAFVAAIQAGILNAPNRTSYQFERSLTFDHTSGFTLAKEFYRWANTISASDQTIEPELQQFGASLYGQNALVKPFTLDKLLISMSEDSLGQLNQIAFAVTPNVMKNILAECYDLKGFAVVEIAAAASPLTHDNLKYRNAIYGFGRSDKAMYNGLMYWAFIDRDGRLYVQGKKIEFTVEPQEKPDPNKEKELDVIEFLTGKLKMNKITHVIHFG